jgi:hypothetical protein
MNIKHAPLRQLFDYWRAKASSREVPRRRDIDPVLEIPAVVPHVGLLDVLEGGRDFRFRVAGGEMRDMFGRELRGARLSEAKINDDTARNLAEFRNVVATGNPGCRFHDFTQRGGQRIRYECLLCPLTDDHGQVHMLLIGMCFDSSYA